MAPLSIGSRLFYVVFSIVVIGVLSWSNTGISHHPSYGLDRRRKPAVFVTTYQHCQSPLLLAQRSDLDNDDQNSNNSKKGYFIRQSMTADIGRASQILTDGFFKAKGMNIFSYLLERLETYLSLEVDFPKPLARHTIFVACDGTTGRVLGMAEVDARTGGRSARGQDGPYMCNVAIDETHQRKGIASSLVQYCEMQVRQWHYETMEEDDAIPNSLYLKVRQKNEAAVLMYDKLGYRSYRQEKDNKGGPVLVMRKELPKISSQQEEKDTKKTVETTTRNAPGVHGTKKKDHVHS